MRNVFSIKRAQEDTGVKGTISEVGQFRGTLTGHFVQCRFEVQW